MTKNWKTTTLGILTILGALTAAGTAILDGDPLTTVNIEATFTAIVAGIGLIVAKDFNVSGFKPPAP